MLLSHRLTVLGSVVLALGAAACVDSSQCEAALGGIERMRAEAAQRDTQLTWLRFQLATFASELSARNAADREVLLQKLTALEAANAALAQRVEQTRLRGEPPEAGPAAAATGKPVAIPGPAPRPPAVVAPPPPAPPERAPPPRPSRQVEARAAKARGIDEASPY